MTVRDLLSDESKWTKGALARTADGRSVLLSDIAATCWCLMGAIFQCYGRRYAERFAAEERLCSAIRSANISGWNDAPERTFAEVRRVVEEAGI